MCSGIRLISKNGVVVVGRTLEFGPLLKFKKYVTAAIKGTSTPDDKLVDGMNRTGLVVFVFYFPKCATYATPDFTKLNVKPTDLSRMLLERCKTCDDVEYLVPKLNIIHEKYPPFTKTPGMHWLVTDASGKSIVLEPEDGGLNIYQNDLGVFTNSPTFPEHLEEAGKILEKVSQFSDPKSDSQGTGAIGLPGDFSSKSRFARLAFFADTIVQPKDGAEAINSLIHILNNFDIPRGAVASVDPQTKKKEYETTMYTAYYNITNRQVLFKDYDNQQIRILQ
ncbi:amindase [Paramecium bursaria Chlorella virus NE-JV-1]|nr:amindase [Paramecium bursaria Chlorella virus NE-JV-1]